MKTTRRRRRPIPEYAFTGCPLTRHHTRRCLRICRPGGDGKGFCGRTAPHSVKGRFQQAVVDYNLRTGRGRHRSESRFPG